MTIKWLYEEEVSAIKMFGRQGASAPLAKCIYASRLIGASKTLVVHGGGQYVREDNHTRCVGPRGKHDIYQS